MTQIAARDQIAARESNPAEATAMAILASISFCHLLNDMMQSLLPALYPTLKESLGLGFGEIGLITLTYQLTASLLQPLVGFLADRRPQPYSLALGMGFTFLGLLLLSRGGSFHALIAAAGLIGLGSSVFHPEASRVARMASGGRHGFAQSFFQVGGNFGSSLGPLLAAFIVLPRGQGSVAWFSGAALLGMIILGRVGAWYKNHMAAKAKSRRTVTHQTTGLSRKKTATAIGILMCLIFSKYFYLASITSYFTFYLIERFHISVQGAQIHLFMFLGAVALGTILGGPIGDRIGRKRVIWVSILGVLPFTLMLPYAGLFWTGILSIVIGVILASAFSAILVFAQELIPGNVGMIAGLFFGFAFGMGGLGAALLGKLADETSITFVYHLCAFLPAIGLLTGFLPDIGRAEPLRLLRVKTPLPETGSCKMNRILKSGSIGLLMLAGVAACTNPNDPGQRAAGGALIGAGSGAALGAIAGGGRGAAIGALAGGAIGAAGGYATTPPPPREYYPPPPPPPGY